MSQPTGDGTACRKVRGHLSIQGIKAFALKSIPDNAPGRGSFAGVMRQTSNIGGLTPRTNISSVTELSKQGACIS